MKGKAKLILLEAIHRVMEPQAGNFFFFSIRLIVQGVYKKKYHFKLCIDLSLVEFYLQI